MFARVCQWSLVWFLQNIWIRNCSSRLYSSTQIFLSYAYR